MLFKILRVVVAVLILGALLYYVGFAQLVGVFSRLEWRYIVYLILLSIALIWVSCLKWQLFVRASGHQVSVLRLMKFYTMSYFFNMFMPSIIGGDVARSYQLGKHVGSFRNAFAATFIERYSGFFAMNLVGLVFVALGAHVTADVEGAVLTVGAITFCSTVVLLSKRLTGWSLTILARIIRLLGLTKLSAKLEAITDQITEAVAFARNDYPLLGKTFLLSLLFHLLAVVNAYICALAIGWNDADFMNLCVVVPLVLLVSVAPVTPSAVGIQEGAFLFFLTRIGATHAEGLGVGLVLRAKNVLTALVGGLIWLISKERSSLVEPVTEAEYDKGVDAQQC